MEYKGRYEERVEELDPDHIYLNATLFNDSPVVNPTRPNYIPAYISQTRSSAILEDPSKWNFSIVRLSVNSSAIPRITESGSNLVVGYSFNNVFYDATVTIPLTPNPEDGLPEQSLYDIDSFMNLVNAAFFTAQTAAAAGGAVFPFGQVFMRYEAESGLFSIYIPEYFGEGQKSVSMATIGVHCSFDMRQRINSFPMAQNFPLQNNGHDITFIKKFNGVNRVDGATAGIGGNPLYLGPPPAPVMFPGNYMLLKQDASWPSSVENVNRVAVTTTTIPVVTEFRTGSLFSQNFGGDPSQTIPIVTDFFAGVNAPLANLGENFSYVPNFLRIASMTTTTPLLRYDISVSTVDRFGKPRPLTIPPSGLLDVKILFLKKGLTN